MDGCVGGGRHRKKSRWYNLEIIGNWTSLLSATPGHPTEQNSHSPSNWRAGGGLVCHKSSGGKIEFGC